MTANDPLADIGRALQQEVWSQQLFGNLVTRP